MVFDKLVDAALRHNHSTLSAPAKANVSSPAPCLRIPLHDRPVPRLLHHPCSTDSLLPVI